MRNEADTNESSVSNDHFSLNVSIMMEEINDLLQNDSNSRQSMTDNDWIQCPQINLHHSMVPTRWKHKE